MLNIVLFGPPGAGKGTQAKKLIDKYKLIHLSTGDILRSEIAEGTSLGMEAKKLMDQGILVPDEVVIGMINSKLQQHSNANGFIFDGFPRTTAQAEALDTLLTKRGTEIIMMLALEVDNEELTKRILLRGKESERADDQNESIVRNRISEYNNKTAPLKEYYSAQAKYHSVNGIGTIDEIFSLLCKVITDVQLAEERFKKEYAARILKKVTKKVPGSKKTKPKKKSPAKKSPPKKAKKKTAKKNTFRKAKVKKKTSKKKIQKRKLNKKRKKR